MENWLDTANTWITYVLTVLILAGAIECGVFLARRHRARDPNKDGIVSFPVSAPSIGLLALMIGFTFAMSLPRFEARTAAVLDELTP
jgi:ABC-type proline/glycine betaine transport system permease subunit